MKRVIYLFTIALLAVTLSNSTPAHAYGSQNQANCTDQGTPLPINSGVAYLIIVGAVVGAVFLRKAVLGTEAEANTNF